MEGLRIPPRAAIRWTARINARFGDTEALPRSSASPTKPADVAALERLLKGHGYGMDETGLDGIRHEEVERRGAFYVERDGKRVAEMTYSRMNDRLVIIDHTEVDRSLGGQGVGRRLLDAGVAWGRETGTRFKVVCPFARAQFTRDASIRDVLG